MKTMVKRLPDKHEAIQGAGFAASTSDGLLRSADVLADAGSYGIARSLAVLAFEESVKSRTLGSIAAAAVHGRRPGFSDDALQKLVYSSHRKRHSAGWLQHIATAFPDTYGKLMLGMTVEADEAAKLGESLLLLAQAETWKQAGFYSDFDPASGTWLSPASISKADFQQIRGLIGDYLTDTRRQLDELTLNLAAGQAKSGVDHQQTPGKAIV